MERILVVDDEVEVCNTLKKFLASKGYEVYTALDGKTFWLERFINKDRVV
ncbi:MAG: hypothetical protein L6247_06515 [Desulfobacteraceae bacterium]|nr:hypothetical protein [Pseudomonadota bacterium]MBU4463631.1 hypothetical protein [Pseudomonadota bacterium]MCG2755197.1 hypothetical protein [Desulfobacteraceae bacterium]